MFSWGMYTDIANTRLPACGMISAAAMYGPISLGIAVCCIVRKMPFLTASMVPALRGSCGAKTDVALGIILYC